jgi:hypothetical protein
MLWRPVRLPRSRVGEEVERARLRCGALEKRRELMGLCDVGNTKRLISSLENLVGSEGRCP